MKIFCDGGARGNPGPAAAAFVVYDSKNRLIHKEAKFLGHATNNVAEYEALTIALEWLTRNQNEDTEIILDSELVKKQMTGEYKVKSPALQLKVIQAKTLQKNLPFLVTYRHTPRGCNSEADALVNKVLDDKG